MDKTDLQRLIDQIASEMGVAVEAVPLDEFIPIPGEAYTRHRLVGQYGALGVYVFDPYSIALSKLDRGFTSVIADIAFLVRANAVDLEYLEEVEDAALAQGHGFGLDRLAIEENLQSVRQQCAQT